MDVIELINDIKRKHSGSFATLWRIYSKHKRLEKSLQLWLALAFTAIFSVLLFFREDWSAILINIIPSIVNKVLSIMPTILGFSLTGYVLFIGFGSSDFVENITEQNDEGYSFFQHFSSIFGWCVLIQSFTLILSFMISIIVDLNLECSYADIVNSIIVIVLFFFVFYSLLLILRFALNMFHLSQQVQFNFTANRLTKSDMEDENN